MNVSDLVVRDPETMGGEPCFRGTRVPVAVLFENLADGLTVDEILESWPTLNRDDVLRVLSLAGEQVRQAAA